MEIFPEGGPLNTRKKGNDQYEMRLSIPPDEFGLVGRECPNGDCSPGFFKVKNGTGLKDQQMAYCPYCRASDDPGGFHTEQQKQYAKKMVEREALKGLQKAFGGMFKQLPKSRSSDFIQISWDYKPGPLPYVSAPAEEQLRRDLTCPICTLEHAVFGLAFWCPDCGADILMTHVAAEFKTIKQMLQDIPRRYKELGARVAARDLENGLEDIVSIFEAVLRVIVRRFWRDHGLPEAEVDQIFSKKIRTGFQNISFADEYFTSDIKISLFSSITEQEKISLSTTFQKRHPITHNLGIVDRAYLKRVQTLEQEGRDVSLSNQEIENALGCLERSLNEVYPALFPAPRKDLGNVESSS